MPESLASLFLSKYDKALQLRPNTERQSLLVGTFPFSPALIKPFTYRRTLAISLKMARYIPTPWRGVGRPRLSSEQAVARWADDLSNMTAA